jgi:hypothetical protein
MTGIYFLMQILHRLQIIYFQLEIRKNTSHMYKYKHCRVFTGKMRGSGTETTVVLPFRYEKKYQQS